jgi:hypothetical protein
MRCPDARRDMFAFLDGAVTVERNLEILSHLNMCPPCGKRFEAERRFEECLCEMLRAEAVPAGLASCLQATLDRADADMAAGRARTGALRLLRGGGAGALLWRLAAAAAAAAFVASGAMWISCAGPFQCHYVRAAVEVPERLDSGDAAFCLVTNDAGRLSAAFCGRGASGVEVPDLSAHGFMLVGGAASVPAPAVDGAGMAICYQSPTARVALVRFTTDGVAPESWNRVERDGRGWYEATHRGRRVLGWVEGDRFWALVTACPCADLPAIARRIRSPEND